MKKLLFIAIAFVLTACGGGDPDSLAPLSVAAASSPSTAAAPAISVPIAQCNGTPKAAIVYAGTVGFPELATVHDACVYTTPAATLSDLSTVVRQATNAAGVLRVSLIGSGDGATQALAWMNANPGASDVASFWFMPFTTDAPGLFHSIVSVHLNDTDAQACAKQAAALPQYVPAQCVMWPDAGFGPDQRAAAISQLHLELIVR